MYVVSLIERQNVQNASVPLYATTLGAPPAAQRGTATPPQADSRTRVIVPGAQRAVSSTVPVLYTPVRGLSLPTTQLLGTERPALGANRCWC